MKCRICGKCIVPIGFARANGKNHSDWNGRFLHKKCWYIEMKEREIEARIATMSAWANPGF